MAQFHEEPADEPIVARMSPATATSIIVQKTNPLAKGSKSKIANRLTDNRDTLKIDYMARRQSSVSSDDIDVPIVSKAMANGSDEFDCWLSDTNQRRSPEGGEDSAFVAGVQEPPPLTHETVRNDVIRSKADSGTSAEKKHKSKKKKEKKERDERKEKKKKRKSRDANDLEDFLNGTDNDGTLIDSAYEAI